MRSTLIAVFALLLLAACASTESLEQLRLATPPTDPYLASLAGDYQTYAEAKAAHNDWDDSEYFADKGLTAAQGQEPMPEDPASWNLPAATIPEFTDAHARLLAAIDANKTTQPALTAEAMLNYDRWMVDVHNDANLDTITESHDGFFASLAKLESVHTVQPGIAAPSSEPVAPVAAAPATPAATRSAEIFKPTVLYFPFDSDSLGASAHGAMKGLAEKILHAGNANVSINGHTDRAGTEAYNMDLSERRARFVQRALIEAGAPAKELHYFAFGESDPAVPTDDGVREPRNRRVEVVIEK